MTNDNNEDARTLEELTAALSNVEDTLDAFVRCDDDDAHGAFAIGLLRGRKAISEDGVVDVDEGEMKRLLDWFWDARFSCIMAVLAMKGVLTIQHEAGSKMKFHLVDEAKARELLADYSLDDDAVESMIANSKGG